MEAATASLQKTPDERKALLAQAVANHVRDGWGVEAQSDYQAVLIKGRHVRHWLHLVLTILTGGLWAVVWLTMWLIYRKRRLVIDVDAYGHTNVQK